LHNRTFLHGEKPGAEKIVLGLLFFVDRRGVKMVNWIVLNNKGTTQETYEER